MKHPVKDSDTEFIIDGSSRLVKNVDDVKSMLVQYDHNSERFTFKVPRYVDEHDLSLCDTVRVHFINIDKTKRMEKSGISEVTDLEVCTDDTEFVCCSWLIPKEATQLAGSLHFVIQFACLDGDRLLYSWNTAKYTGISIADGINVGESIIDENTDILTKWENELKANQIVNVEQTSISTEDNGENVWTATFGDGRIQEFKVRNGSRGPTGRIGSIETISGSPLHFSVGTQEEYDALSDEQKQDLFAIITDEEYPEIKRDENGVLKIGDIIIPQKKILRDKLYLITNNLEYVYEDPESLTGRTFEADVNNRHFKFKVGLGQPVCTFAYAVGPNDSNPVTYTCWTLYFHPVGKKLGVYCYRYKDGVLQTDATLELKQLWEIIE